MTKQLSLDHARILYRKDWESRDIALEYFSEDQLKERTLPKTWEEYEATLHEMFANVKAPREIAIALDNLVKLYLLKQEYNGDWVPKGNWRNCWGVLVDRGNGVRLRSYFLLFKSPELRDQFAANFKDLIEAAKPLLG